MVTLDQSVRANGDGTIAYGGERWIAVKPLQFRNVADGRQLTFQEDSSGKIRFMNRESERVAWYQSGPAAIAFYFGFILLSNVVSSGATVASKTLVHFDGWRRLS